MIDLIKKINDESKNSLSDILVRRLLVSFIPILKRTLSEYKKEITF